MDWARLGISDLTIPQRSKRGWAKGIVRWRFEGWHCLSVPFTWLLPEAAEFCATHENCLVGGPAVKLMPEYIGRWAEVSTEDLPWALSLYNPDASRSTRGCLNACSFCGVSRIEGPFEELKEWTPATYMIDSNFLQCSDRHFEATCDRLQVLPEVEFNQGLDASLFTGARAERLLELPLRRLQFSWDNPSDYQSVAEAVELAKRHGLRAGKICIMRLVNNGEEPESALENMLELRGWGVSPFAMRYQPLDALRKNDYLAPQWNSRDLKWFCRYWNRQAWLGGVEFKWPSRGPQFNLPLEAM